MKSGLGRMDFTHTHRDRSGPTHVGLSLPRVGGLWVRKADDLHIEIVGNGYPALYVIVGDDDPKPAKIPSLETFYEEFRYVGKVAK